MAESGSGYQPTGVRLVLVGNAGFAWRIERAPDVAGSPGAWGAIGTAPIGAGQYTDVVAAGGLYWYRAYHTRTGWQDSATPAVTATAITPYQLPPL